MKHHRTSILIADDHEVVRSGIRSYLEKISDFHVLGEASSGEETLGMVSELIPDIVLLDLIMPGMDGIETTRRIRHIRGENGEEQPLFTELTDRETDVLKLIAAGLTNSQIAEKLVISENTVKGHVSNILSKLHLADRTQAAVYAWQQGIVNRQSTSK